MVEKAKAANGLVVMEKATTTTITLMHQGADYDVTWYAGSTSAEIDAHVRKRLRLTEKEMFTLHDEALGQHVVLTPALPANSRFTVLVEGGNCGGDVGNFKVVDDEVFDQNITKIRPLVAPALLLEELPQTAVVRDTVKRGRKAVESVIAGKDDRLVVIVGPCSIHDPQAALDYAKRLHRLTAEVRNELVVVMRVYFEKPRTTVGWKGLINDPDLDDSYNINKGIRIARKLLLDINALGVPCGCEFLDTISPQFIADLVSWGAIGARTTECQLHRELASGLSMPIGFKNGTSGNVSIAVDAVVAAKHAHNFLSVSTQGLSSIVNTRGNGACHVILRGGRHGPNYEEPYIAEAREKCQKSGVEPRLMVDCSHGNSLKVHTNQPIVAANLGAQLAAGNHDIFGVMIESNINEGNQKLKPGQALNYGVSITDACINWDMTVSVLKGLAESVKQRRNLPVGSTTASPATPRSATPPKV